jgi:hypothetical protein
MQLLLRYQLRAYKSSRTAPCVAATKNPAEKAGSELSRLGETIKRRGASLAPISQTIVLRHPT